MSARSGLVGKNPPGRIWGHFRSILPWTAKIQTLKIKIRSAKKVGKDWISRKKSSWPHLGPFQGNFSVSFTIRSTW